MIEWAVGTLIGALVLVGTWFAARRAGAKAQQEKVDTNLAKNDAATREKVKEINEKIRTNPDTITQWLRDTNRFRK